jgi:hypothetical protein
MGKLSDKIKDSALYRIARNVGFNARVEPFWLTFEKLGPRMGFFERWKEKRRLKKILARVREALAKQGAPADAWEDRRGECVCNLRVAKTGLVAELQQFVRESAKPEQWGKWRHLMAQRDHSALLIPVEFAEPIPLPSEGEPGSVTSAPRMAAELAEVNRILKIDETFALAKAKKVDYLDASERDISIYESRFGTVDGFWGKFAYVLLKKLADTAGERGLPAIFA